MADGLARGQSQVPVDSSFSSVLVWIGENDENASVDENILLRFRGDENRQTLLKTHQCVLNLTGTVFPIKRRPYKTKRRQ